MKHFSLPGKILRNSEEFWQQLQDDRDLGGLAVSLLIISYTFFGAYGLMMGLKSGPMQALSSALKLPILFLLTLLICLPTLHLLQLLFGSRRSLMQLLVLALATMAATSSMLLGFAPVTAFFTMTTQNYQFIKLLNVMLIGFSAVIGVKFFLKGMAKTARSDPNPGMARADVEPASHKSILNGWILLYSFVGTQLAWTLRPFMGDPGLPFEWVRRIGGNFYIDIVRAVTSFFGS